MKKRILYSMLGAVIATALVFTFVVQLVQMNFLSRQIELELERSVRQLGVAPAALLSNSDNSEPEEA